MVTKLPTERCNASNAEPMIAEQAEIILTREELYERVWSKFTGKVAAEPSLSDVGLAKVCKKPRMPKPTRGCWAKVLHGKPVVQWPLRPTDDAGLNTIRFTPRAKKIKSSEPEPLARDPEIVAKIEAELRPENRIELLFDFRGADPFVRATREGLVGHPNHWFVGTSGRASCALLHAC